MDLFGIELWRSIKRMEKLIKLKRNPKKPYNVLWLKKCRRKSISNGGWKKIMDIAISRVKLNIEIDTEYHSLTMNKPSMTWEKPCIRFTKDYTIRIPT